MSMVCKSAIAYVGRVHLLKYACWGKYFIVGKRNFLAVSIVDKILIIIMNLYTEHI